MNKLEFDPSHCTLCPRKCGGDRRSAAGRCRMPAEPLLARAALHRWEEPPVSGTRGAGTVFFSGCSLGCVFCQNYEISQEDKGRPVTADRLREIFFDLIAAGAHNIDLVNPTHYAHAVAEVLEDPLPATCPIINTPTLRVQNSTPARRTTRKPSRPPSGRWSGRPGPVPWMKTVS